MSKSERELLIECMDELDNLDEQEHPDEVRVKELEGIINELLNKWS